MTNEELQTLIKNACKAAGWQIKKTLHPSVVSVWINGAPYVVKLADDDGDSRMLQVACRIDMFFYKNSFENECVLACDCERTVESFESIRPDANKAARMAVLRCAALIGEAME